MFVSQYKCTSSEMLLTRGYSMFGYHELDFHKLQMFMPIIVMANIYLYLFIVYIRYVSNDRIYLIF